MKYLHTYLFFTLVSMLISCDHATKVNASIKGGADANVGEQIFCDAEKVSGDDFETNGTLFMGSNARTSEFAFEGKYSIKINKDNQFGFTYVFEDLKEGERIHAYVWKKGSEELGTIVIADDEGISYSSSKTIIERKGDWCKLMTSFVVSKGMKSIKVYCFNPNEESVYFDELHIEHFASGVFQDFEKKKIAINIPESAYDSISKFRDIAIEQGVISKDLKKYFDAVAIIEGSEVPIEIRLKGDWPDHLEEGKWS
ncbi:MAG: hypothetical protein MK066_08485, partial [Crocinitomicaceae bacterium]|nr:hypothetical protein [Crocinitomicaceae bacterium]